MKPQYNPTKSFTSNVRAWVVEAFGVTAANDRCERVHRFLEEALELAQAAGCSKTEAAQLLDYVYGRHVGEPAQEVGGVMTTLAALCAANGLDSERCGRAELARCWTNIAKIRIKQAAKPKYGPPEFQVPNVATMCAVSPKEYTRLLVANFTPQTASTAATEPGVTYLPCVICSDSTPMACSDCAIDGLGAIHVCGKGECQWAHERTHKVDHSPEFA